MDLLAASWCQPSRFPRDDIGRLRFRIEHDHDFSAIELTDYCVLFFLKRVFLLSVVGAITSDKLLDQSVESLLAEPVYGNHYESHRVTVLAAERSGKRTNEPLQSRGQSLPLLSRRASSRT